MPGPAPGAIDAEAIRTAWPRVVDRLFGMKKATWSLVKEHAKVLDYDGRRLVLGISSPGLTTTFRGGAHGEFVRQALIDELAVDAQVEAVHGDTPPSREPSGSARAASRAAADPGRTTGVVRERRPADGGRAAQDGGEPVRGGRGHGGPAGVSTAASQTGPGAGSDAEGDAGPAVEPAAVERTAVESTAVQRAAVERTAVEPPGWDDVPPPTEEPGDPEPAPEPPSDAARGVDGGAGPAPAARIGSARARLRESSQAGPAEPGSTRRRPPVAPADDVPSADDADADDSGLVGRSVVERLLGGRVIDETSG